MFTPRRLAHGGPANTQYHVRFQVRLTRLHVPYVRPVVHLTTRSGARL